MSFYENNAELIACISFLIPLVPAWIIFNKLSAGLKFFVIILSVSAVFTFAGYYTGLHYIHNLQLYFIQYVLQFYLYSLLFLKILHNRYSRRFVRTMMLLFVILILLNFKNIAHPATFDSYTPAFLSLAMLLYCILFYNGQLSNFQVIFIYKTPWFWIVTGLLLYFAGSFLILLTTNYFMYRNTGFITELWLFRSQINVIKNLLIAISLFYIKNKGCNSSF